VVCVRQTKRAGGLVMDASVEQKLASAHRARTELDYDQAKSLYESVLAAESDCAEALHGLGFVLMMGYGQFDEGLQLMEKAAELAPRDQDIVLDLAKSYAMLGHDEKVKPLLEHVIALGETTKAAQEARKQMQYYS
jgi:tetratricopeptide (TPR) repeat protein